MPHTPAGKSQGSLRANILFAAKMALPLSLLAAVTFCLFGPVDMYFSNLNDFWFSFQQLIAPMLIAAAGCFAVMAAVLMLAGLLLPRKLFGLLSSLLFGLLAAAYIQGTFLSGSMETLTGAGIQWSAQAGSMLCNTLLWLGVVFVCLAFYLMKTKSTLRVMRFVCYMLTGVQLLTGTVTYIGYRGGNAATTHTGLITEGLYDVSANQNVMVFLLDTLDARHFDTLMQEAPQALDGYDGFTYYHNMSGSYRCTDGSMAYIFTNEKYLNKTSFNDYQAEFLPKSPLLNTLKNNGYDVRISASQFLADYLAPGQVDNMLTVDTVLKSRRTFIETQLRFMAYRYGPAAMRPFFFANYNDTFDSLIGYLWDNGYSGISIKPSLSLQALARHETQLIEPDAFRFIYLWGAHRPFCFNAEGEDVPDDSATRMETLQGSFKVVTTMLERMKALGVYDQSTIVIMSDHGDDDVSSPAFLVKYPQAHGDITLNQAPVSYDDLTATFLKAAGCADYADYGTPVDEWPEDAQRQRFYYQYDFVEPQKFATYFRAITEYAVPADAADLTSYQQTGNVYMPVLPD